MLDLHITEFPKENLKMIVGIKFHPLALQTGLQPTFVMYVLEGSNSNIFGQLELFSYSTSLLCSSSHFILQPHPSRILVKASRKLARNTKGDYLIRPCLSTAFPWAACGFIWTGHMARSTQELNVARSGACWGEEKERQWGVLWRCPAVLWALREPSEDLTFLSSSRFCLSWCQMSCGC